MTIQVSFLDIFRSAGSLSIKFFKMLDYLIGGTAAFLLPAVPAKELPPEIKKILVIRPGGIGDAVFVLPFVRALKDQGIAVDILCEERNGAVFTSQSHLFHKIYFYDRQPLGVLKNSYDVVVDTEQWHYLSAVTAYFVRSSYRIGFATRRRAKLFHKKVEYGTNDQEWENFFRLFHEIGRPDAQSIDSCFMVESTMQAWAKAQISDNTIALFLGASIALRRLNEEQLLAMARHFIAKDFFVVLLGGKDVERSAQRLMPKISSPKVLNWVGKTSLVQTAALIQKSRLFIGPDSGIMHLAGAVGTPVVGIFGPGNLKKWGPRGEKHNVITENVSCAPCTRFGYTIPTCQGSYHCMRTIKLSEIFLTTEKYLSV